MFHPAKLGGVLRTAIGPTSLAEMRVPFAASYDPSKQRFPPRQTGAAFAVCSTSRAQHRGAALGHPHLADVADKHFGFMDADVRITHQGREIVYHITNCDPLVAPVPGHPHVVQLLAVDGVWSHPLGDQRLRLDGGAWRADLH